jgi:hypothetical protein
MNIQTDISVANVRRWIDTATTYAAARPHRTKGQKLLQSAATETLKDSGPCPDVPDV